MNTYLINELARNMIAEIADCGTNKTVCKSRDGHHFAVCVNHNETTPTDTIAKRALDAVKMTMRVHGRYAAAEALEYLHVRNGDCMKVNAGNSVYTVLWVTI